MDDRRQTTQELVSRRAMLKLTGAGLGGLLLKPAAGAAYTPGEPHAEDAAMLYDASKCVGCRECEVACKEWNQLPVGPVPPQDLSDTTFTVIRRYQDTGNAEEAFCKYQCMHCLYPACAAVCPVAALHKLDGGPVVYDESRCIGCRYCMVACPFGIPRYEWSQPIPFVRKCNFCADREGGPACAAACPTGALSYGQRREMLWVAETRIAENPGKYAEDRVYGKDEVGGTSVLYLSHVPFDKVGLPKLDTIPLPSRTEWALQIIPAIIVGVGGLMSAIYWITKRRTQVKRGKLWQQLQQQGIESR